MKTIFVENEKERELLLDISTHCIKDNEYEKIKKETLPFLAVWEEEMIWLNENKTDKVYFDNVIEFKKYLKMEE